MTRTDAAAKLAGRVTFGMDLDQPGMLWGVLVPSPLAHGRLDAVDTSEARGMDGVEAAIGPSEVARILPSAQASERPLFPTSEVVYRGQPVGGGRRPNPRAGARGRGPGARLGVPTAGDLRPRAAFPGLAWVGRRDRSRCGRARASPSRVGRHGVRECRVRPLGNLPYLRCVPDGPGTARLPRRGRRRPLARDHDYADAVRVR